MTKETYITKDGNAGTRIIYSKDEVAVFKKKHEEMMQKRKSILEKLQNKDTKKDTVEEVKQ